MAGGNKPSSLKKEEEHSNSLSDSKPAVQKKHRGWKAMPYILGNETFERLATCGLTANFMVYLTKEFHLNQVVAANIINIWGGITNFAPLIGAFISDAYAGRFKTIVFASFASLLGMLAITLMAWLPQLHPPKCDIANQSNRWCKGPNQLQLGVLLSALGLLSIGTGGIRPCSIPFGTDQFDPTTEAGVKGMNSFFNWYYTSFTVVILIAQTSVVYIQDSVSWVLGFGIPTLLMLAAIILFLIGTKVYVHVEPEGSIFSGIAKVFVAAYKRRRLKLPEGQNDGLFYNPLPKGTVLSKQPLTNQFRFLNKAAMITDNDLKSDGTCTDQNKKLCSIQQVEEVKWLLKIIPIWVSGIISFISMTQQSTFTVSQAMKMDRHLRPNFEIPAASVTVISLLTIVIWVPFYDRIFVPALRRVSKRREITVLQRCGIGIIFSILSMIAAGVVERKRREWDLANLHAQSLWVMWLAPQLILMGFCEAFHVIGMLEFFNKEFPDRMKCIGNSLIYCSIGGANYLSSLIVTIIQGITSKYGRRDWLTDNINAGRLDYFYLVIAGLEVLNLIYFLYCARHYRYKDSLQFEERPSLEHMEQAGSITGDQGGSRSETRC
ncbi:NRT1/PTR family protein 2.2 [Melia azedarach]|uniref:NRT1/PTR family protein 2.2 n=1 Tax=Melia azedarach TaxID=155640 RepID=A0ACC1XIH9_MELAZ|nr:NRT1/PTR family protein 2.2 [Melia azedarach]